MLIVWSRVPRALPGRHRPSRRDLACGELLLSLDLGDRPDEPGELAGGGDRDDRAALRSVLEPVPGAVQPLLGLPADRDDVGGLPVLAALEGDAAGGGLAGRGTTSARCPRGSFSDAALPNPA